MSSVVTNGQRGQALVESVLFLPLLLLALFAIIYFSQYGVLQERAQSAVRYGALVSNDGQNPYSIALLYDQFTNPHSGVPTLSCAANTGADTASALVQAQPAPANAPPGYTSAQTYWRPDAASTSALCSPTNIGLAGGDPLIADTTFVVNQTALSATETVPAYLTSLLGLHGNVSATMSMLRPVPAGTMIYCVPKVAAPIANALGGWEGPYAGYKAPTSTTLPAGC